MTPEHSPGPGRIFRPSEGRWVGAPLPPIENPSFHDLDAHTARIAYWIFSTCTDIARNDVLVVGERTRLLLDPCGPRHFAVQTMRDVFLAQYDDDEWAHEWLDSRQVWSTRRIDPDELRRAVNRKELPK